ncbi:MAG: general secretion pathway protein GspB, partial [Pseudomonadota bacterium]|nr:general secretion pathway protein GspB [Pseudomonadota bacterium]
LRKAEQKRKLENIPELESAIVRGGNHRRTLPWGWLALILLLSLALTALVVFRQPLLETGRNWLSEIGQPTEEADSKPATVTDERDRPQHQEKPNQVETKRQPDRLRARRGGGAQPGGSRQPQREASATEQTARLAVKESVEKQVVEQAQQPDETAPQQDGDGPLPAALQHKLDAVNLTVISYSSDPVKRFIMAGADILREGDSLPGGILISQIRKQQVLVEIEGREAILTP